MYFAGFLLDPGLYQGFYKVSSVRLSAHLSVSLYFFSGLAHYFFYLFLMLVFDKNCYENDIFKKNL